MIIAPINTSYDEEQVKEVISNAIETFYEKLISTVKEIDINVIMKRKNPYLYRVKNLQDAEEIVSSIVEAYVSSSEETIFGNTFFEPLALVASGGKKSISEGVDAEIDNAPIRTAIAVKSGIAVFNADSRKKQTDNFNKARERAMQAGLTLNPVIGFSYGSKAATMRQGALELAGEEFWTYITGDKDFYKKIIDYMGDKPAKYQEDFNLNLVKAKNRMVREFSNQFMDEDGAIDWDAIVDYNSSSPTRKEQEEFDRIKKLTVLVIRNQPGITKKPLREAIKCKESQLDKALKLLKEEGEIAQGYGTRYGWHVVSI